MDLAARMRSDHTVPVRILLILTLLCLGADLRTSAQSVAPHYGPFREDRTNDQYHGIAFVRQTGQGRVELLGWQRGRTTFDRLVISRDTAALTVRTTPAPGRFDSLLTADVDGDGKRELVLLEYDSMQVQIMRLTDASSLERRALIRLDRTPRKIVVTDLNRDGRPDLLVYDDQEPGILPVFHRSGGRWEPGRVIAPDLPVRHLAVLHLNNDGLLDLLAFDWVTNRLHLLYGVGRERFLDQGSFEPEGSCDGLFVEQAAPEHALRLAMFDRQAGRLTFYEVNDRGDLVAVSRSTVGSRVRDVYAMSGGRHASAMVMVTETAVLALDDPFLLMTPAVREVGVPGRVVSSVMLPSGQLMLLLSDRRLIRISVYGDNDAPRTSAYLVPRQPVSVLSGDFNADGKLDLVTVSASGGILQYLWGDGSGGFSGSESVGLVPGSEGVLAGAHSDSASRFYLVSRDRNIISVATVNRADQSLTQTDIPVQGSPTILGEFRTERSTTAFATLQTMANGSASVATYEQIGEETYLEQSFAVGPPAQLFGAELAPIDDDAIPDFIIVYRPDDTSAVSLGVVYADTARSDDRIPIRSTLPVRDVRRTYLWYADVDRDSIPDLVAVFPRAAQRLFVLRSTRDTLFAIVTDVDTLVRLEDRSRFRVEDADGDGLPDLIAVLPDRGGLGWWKNQGEGRFGSWRLLLRGPDISGFVLARLSGRSVPEWGVISSARSTLKVFAGREMLAGAHDE